MNPADRIGSYRLINRLAHGGMGEVWAAEGPAGKVAIKIIPEFLLGDRLLVDRLRREAEAVGRLNHPSIVRVIELGESEGRTFLAMELLIGETLADRLARQNPLPVSEVERVGRALALALSYIHSEGIIHRDLKPQNVFLTHDGGVKLIDLGIAKILDEASLTVTGSHFGTPAYMSPESFRDSKNVTVAADVWSLGVILYELSTGRLPFPGTTAASIIAKISDTNVTPASPTLLRPEIPRHLAAWIESCIRRDPENRFLPDDLSAHDPSSAHADLNLPSTRRTLRAAFLSAAAFAALIVALHLGISFAPQVLENSNAEGVFERSIDLIRSDRGGAQAAYVFVPILGWFIIGMMIYRHLRAGPVLALAAPVDPAAKKVLFFFVGGFLTLGVMEFSQAFSRAVFSLEKYLTGMLYLVIALYHLLLRRDTVTLRPAGVIHTCNLLRWCRMESFEWIRKPKSLILRIYLRSGWLPLPAPFRRRQFPVAPERRALIDRVMRGWMAQAAEAASAAGRWEVDTRCQGAGGWVIFAGAYWMFHHVIFQNPDLAPFEALRRYAIDVSRADPSAGFVFGVALTAGFLLCLAGLGLLCRSRISWSLARWTNIGMILFMVLRAGYVWVKFSDSTFARLFAGRGSSSDKIGLLLLITGFIISMCLLFKIADRRISAYFRITPPQDLDAWIQQRRRAALAAVVGLFVLLVGNVVFALIAAILGLVLWGSAQRISGRRLKALAGVAAVLLILAGFAIHVFRMASAFDSS